MVYVEMIVSYLPICCTAMFVCCCLSGSSAYAYRRKNKVCDENIGIKPPETQEMRREVVLVENSGEYYLGVPCSTK